MKKVNLDETRKLGSFSELQKNLQEQCTMQQEQWEL